MKSQQKVKLPAEKVQQIAGYHAWVMAANTIVYFFSGSMVLFASISFISIAIFCVANRDSWRQFGYFGGYANLVTGLRFLVLMLLCFFNNNLHNYIIFGATLLVTISDGFDGYLARKFNTCSTFGEYFDSETDAFFVLSVTVLMLERGMAGSWVLLPGLLRYVYVIAISLLKYPQYSDGGGSFRRRFIGAYLMGTLIGCFLLPSIIYTPALVLASLLVTYSFVLDFALHLKRVPAKVG